MTLTLRLATWLGEERGRSLAEVTDQTKLVCIPKLYHNTNARVALAPETAAGLEAQQYEWREDGPREAMVVNWKAVLDWDGLAKAKGARKPAMELGGPDKTALENVAATGLTMARNAILGSLERNARMLEQEGKGRTERMRKSNEVVLDTHAAWIGEGGPELDDTWARFCLRDAECNGELVLAGTKTTAADVLERAAGGESYEEITRLSGSELLPEGVNDAAVRAAAATAALLIMNRERLPAVKEPLERVPGRCGGRPVLKGSRLGAADILGSMTNGMTMTEIAADYEQKVEEVVAAVLYGAAVLREDRGGRKQQAGEAE